MWTATIDTHVEVRTATIDTCVINRRLNEYLIYKFIIYMCINSIA